MTLVLKLPFLASRWFFKPRLLPTLMSFAFIVLFILLGRWQWQRADYKEQIHSRFLRGQQSAALDIDAVVSLGKDANSFPVIVKGRFDNAHSILLDNQVENGVAGFQVLTPLTLANNHRAILVDRGWLPLGKDRSHFSAIPLIEDKSFRLSGRVYFPSEKQFVLQQDNYADIHWPLLVQKLDLPGISKALGVELPPFVVRLDSDQQVETGQQLPRHWQFVVIGAEKSRGYSLQWYSMALVLFLFYCFFSVEKVKINE